MTPNGWLQIAFFFVLLLLAAKPMGLYMARVYERKKTLLDPCWGRWSGFCIALPASMRTRRCAGPSMARRC